MRNNRGTSGETSSGGIGFTGLLTIVFIVLKLMKVISWSWWWVLSPAWITLAIIILAAVIYVVVVVRNDKL